jgi:hypothetical protein
LVETGLDTPRGELEVRYADGVTLALAIGAPGPLGGDLFARRTEPGADGRIDRIDRSVHSALQVNPSEARDAMVFRNDLGSLRKVRVVRRIPESGVLDKIGIVRAGSAQWRIEEPAHLRADARNTMLLAGAIAALRIREFLPGAPAAQVAGPDAPDDVRIELEGGFGEEVLGLRFDRSNGMMLGHVTPRDIWFLTPIERFDSYVGAKLEELRARSLIDHSIEEITAIRIERPDDTTPIEVVRDQVGTLRLRRPVDVAVDATVAAEQLEALGGLVARRFVADDLAELGRFGLLEAATKVTLEVRGREPLTIRLGAAVGDGEVAACRDGEKHVVAIHAEVAQRLMRPWTSYVDRRLLSIESSGLVGRLVHRRADGTRAEWSRDAEGAWASAGGAKVGGLEAVVDVLRELRGEQSLSRDTVATATAIGSLDVVAPTGAALASVELWFGAEDRAFCALARIPGVVFRLNARDSQALAVLRTD